MEEPLYPKRYFKEMYTTYPTLTYNQILLNVVEKFNLKKINYILIVLMSLNQIIIRKISIIRV